MAANADVLARPVPPWRQKAVAFWRWWTGELAQLLPDRLAASTRVPVVCFTDGDLVLVEPRAAVGAEARVAVSTLDPSVARAAVRDLLVSAGETRSLARLRLRADQVLVRRVTMPGATEENLPQVVAFEMDRLTPFRGEDVYHDERVVSRDPASAQIVVQLAVARREVVDAAVNAARDLGINVRGVLVPETAAPGAAGLDLLPSEQREERDSPNDRMIRRAMWGVVAVLLLMALLLPAWQKREAAIGLLPVLAKAETDAKASDTLARELERQVADYNYLLTKKNATPSLAFIEELSRLLPDNTWVQQFDLRATGKTREVQITGETPSSSKLIELLEQSTLLQNAAPRGAVTRASQPGFERFVIAAEARVRPLPELRPATELAAIAPPPPPRPIAMPSEPAAPAQAKSDEGDEPQGQSDASATAPPKAGAPATAQVVPAPPPSIRTLPREEQRAVIKAERDAIRQRAVERARRMEEQRRAAQGAGK